MANPFFSGDPYDRPRDSKNKKALWVTQCLLRLIGVDARPYFWHADYPAIPALSIWSLALHIVNQLVIGLGELFDALHLQHLPHFVEVDAQCGQCGHVTLSIFHTRL